MIRAGLAAAVVGCLAGHAAGESFCASTRIAGGEEAAPDAWPSQVAVVRPQGGSRAALCGGTVIQQNWVLTAAHCVFEDADHGVGLLPPSAFRVIDKTLKFREGGEHIRVREVLTRGYHGFKYGNDVALLELERPTSVPAMGLVPEQLVPKLAPPGTTAIVVGWGTKKSDSDEASSTLQQVAVPIVDFQACKKSYAELVPSQICAGYAEGGKDSCGGDSGGPLMIRDVNGRYVQLAVVSFGHGCAEPGFPGVYEEAGPHLTWIREHVPDVLVAGGPGSASTGDQGVGPVLDDLAAGANGERIQLSVLPQPRVNLGSTIKLRIDSAMSGKLLLMDARDTGALVQLFPNQFRAPYVSADITAGKPRIVPDPSDGFEFAADEVGPGRILAIVSKNAIRVDGLSGRHLDLEPIPEPRAHLGALCDGLRAVRVEHAGDWVIAKQAYEIVR